MAVSDPQAKMKKLIEEKPLAHPGVFAMYARDYEYSPPEHLRNIYGQVYRGLKRNSIKHLCHLKPREHGKSEGGTVDNAAWNALQDPSSRTLIMSEGSALAEKKLSQVREVIEQEAPKFGISFASEPSNSSIELANSANHGESTIEAAGFGSSITGGHFDLIIFDDLVDWPSQRTEARRTKIWKQFQNYLNLGSEGDTVYLVLGTRKHPDDLYQRLIDSAGWYVEVDRAIDDWSVVEDQAYDLVTEDPKTGERSTYDAADVGAIPQSEAIVDAEPHRDAGVLWPERWPLNKLLVDMHAGFGGDEGNLVWKRENQNAADALQGQVLSADMLTFVHGEDVPPLRDMQVSFGLDPAVEEDPEKAATNDTDYWALAKLAHDHDSDRTFVVNVWRRRGMSMKTGIDWVRSRTGGYSGQVLVEDQQAQRWFVQEARDTGLNVRGTSSPPGTSKEDRIIQMSARFESGKVVLAGTEDDWSGSAARVPKFVNEWCSFPTADHDDRLDGVEIALRGTGGQVMSRGKHDMSELPM